MKVTIEVGVSSATLMLALRELKRQQAAMEERATAQFGPADDEE